MGLTCALARQLQWMAVGLTAIAATAGCGDPVLPSDYAGPPAEGVQANVLVLGTVTARDAGQPRLSLEWLRDLRGLPGESRLAGQPLRFSRSLTVQTDWDIGLELPLDFVKLDPNTGAVSAGGLRVSVGKMVYYDDRNRDGQLDWSCRLGTCDLAKAVSVEFVVYVEGITPCRNINTMQTGLEAVRPTVGYNYYQLTGNTLRKLRAGEPMSFLLTDRSLPESDPSDELRSFAASLFNFWARTGSLIGGC